MNELYGISYALIRHPSSLRHFLVFLKFIIDGLFMVRATTPAASPPAKSRGRPPKETPLEIEAMSEKEKETADKGRQQPAGRQRQKQKATTTWPDNAAREALIAAREEQAREELTGMEDFLNEKTPPPSPARRQTNADRQQVHMKAKESNERARLAAEVEQLKSQLEKEKKRRQSQSVAEPTPKRAKLSAAACRKKLVKSRLSSFRGFTIY
jgi:hypothetical protein